MSNAPYMQLYVADYLGDTQHLTTEQHGAYLLLLMTMWRAGGYLPNAPDKLARIARVSPRRWHIIAADVMPFFTVSGDRITQKRLEREHQKALSISEKRSVSGEAGGRAKALKNKNVPLANGTDLLQHRTHVPETIYQREEEPIGSLSETSSDQSPVSRKKRASYPPDFEAFWTAYPTDENMSKKAAGDVWARLDREDRAAARAGIPGFIAYCQSHPDYRPVHAVRFLRDRRWEGYLKAAQQAASKVFIEEGSAEWTAWKAVQRLPVTEHEGRRGWWLPSRLPPEQRTY